MRHRPVSLMPSGGRVLAEGIPHGELWTRVLCMLALVLVAYARWIGAEVRIAEAGSAAAFALTLPILGAIIAGGYNTPPRGVSDGETDWITAILIGGAGLLTLHLITLRVPTLAAFLRLDTLGPVVWVASVSIVVFSARHVVRMWPLWLFLLITSPSLTTLLLTAHLGGREDNVVLATAMLGTVAVFLSGRVATWPQRLLATVLNLALATGVDRLLAPEGANHVLRVMISAAAIPLLTIFVLHHVTHVTGTNRVGTTNQVGITVTRFPRRRTWSYQALIVLTLLLLWAHPVPAQPTAIPHAGSDWVTAMKLQPTERFDFITRFLGPGSAMTRYRSPTQPTVAIDVISTPNLSRLNDYANAMWYPAPEPLNYRTSELSGLLPVLSAYHEADGAYPGWYLLTWRWQTDETYQQVFVVVGDAGRADGPVTPRAVSVRSSLIDPFIWVVRQLPTPADDALDDIVGTAKDLARQILTAGAVRPASS